MKKQVSVINLVLIETLALSSNLFAAKVMVGQVFWSDFEAQIKS